MHRLLLSLVWVSLFGLLGCLNGTRPSPKEKGEAHSLLGDTATRYLLQSINQYMELKEALVMDQGAMASLASGKLSGSLQSWKNQLDRQDLLPREEETRLYLDTLIRANQKILSQDARDLEWKRYYFAQVSEVLHRLLVLAEWEGTPIYQMYCPLAFNDHGAYWLSLDSEIRNPYFGRPLMECGEVIDQIP